VQCVIHSHAEDVLPYVVSGVPLRPVYHMAGFLGTNVPVFDVAPLYDQTNTPVEKRDMLINNTTLGKGLADKFAAESDKEGDLQHSVVLMRRHGFTCQADSIEKAVYRGIYTKINAKALTDSLAARKNFEGLGTMAFDAGDMALSEELTIGSTAMNERFQYVTPSSWHVR
jgi:ribulose-5-phosphate 4-epimerase/fuculose-1-phosphate aldolase